MSAKIKHSPESFAAFKLYWADRWNWAGDTMVDGNVPWHPSHSGFITNWKAEGLINTFVDRRDTFIYFYDSAEDFAACSTQEEYDALKASKA